MCKIYFSQRWLKLCLAGMLACICFFSPGNAFAKAGETIENPPQTINGTVRDAGNGQPLGGATINIKGGSQSTATDAKGAFTIVVPDNSSILVVSYIGYATQEVPVRTSGHIEIALQPNSAELNQVVVVGYGTQNKRDITGSVKSIKSEAFNKGIINSPQELLQGKVSGVNVTSASGEPGGIMGITVRGPGGIRTGSTPLFVVDGLPLDNSSTGGGDPLSFINPQ
ncbi:MAG: TonB-dependent receptor SusC, partial [Segetibacter sp.]|nr:TonB-dependent receptor SusC [Segetibacter sp.]